MSDTDRKNLFLLASVLSAVFAGAYSTAGVSVALHPQSAILVLLL